MLIFTNLLFNSVSTRVLIHIILSKMMKYHVGSTYVRRIGEEILKILAVKWLQYYRMGNLA